MNKNLISNVDTTINEGYSMAMGKLYHNMSEYNFLCKKLNDTQKQLEQVISPEYLEMFAQFVQVYENRGYFEQKYMYIQGMKDYADILNYLDDGGMDKYLLNYDFKYKQYDDE